MSKAQLTQKGSMGMTSIPQQRNGERPYYFERYLQYAKGGLHSKEMVSVFSDLIWAGCTEFDIGNYSSHNFAPNERMQSLLQNSLQQVANPETWEKRAEASRMLFKIAMPVCEQAVYATSPIFKKRTPVPSTLVPLDGTTSFVARDVGMLIHVWKSHRDAKMFVGTCAMVQEKLHQLRIDTVFCPYSALMTIHGFTVTFTPLVPLVSDKSITTFDSPLMGVAVNMLATYAHTKEPIKVYRGADGRVYIMEPTAVIHNDGESNGEISNFVRTELMMRYPDVPATHPMAIKDAMLRETDDVVDDLLDAIKERGERAGGVHNVKIQEALMDRLVPRKFHNRGYKMNFLFTIYDHKKLRPQNTANDVLKELLVAEMICRALKEVIRAEINTTSVIPAADASIDQAIQFVVELANRCTFALLVKEDMWDTHLLPVLRIKFHTPDSFVISQLQVTKRAILAFMAIRVGTVFEGGKFVRIAPLNLGTTLPKPDDVTKLILTADMQGAHQLLLNNWKRVNDTRDEDVLFLSMLHQVTLFAMARSQSLDWYVNLFLRKLSEMNEPTTLRMVQPILIECFAELPSLDKHRKEFQKYLEKDIPEIGKDAEKQILDVHTLSERRHHFTGMFSSIEKGRERETHGNYSVQSAHSFLDIPDTKKLLMGNNVVDNMCHAMLYIYAQENRHDDVRRFKEALQQATTTDERWGQLCSVFQQFSGNSLYLRYKPSEEAILTYWEAAVTNREMHATHYGESDTRYHVSLMLEACHWALLNKGELTREEFKAMQKLQDATLKVHGALKSEQKGMLAGDWYLAMTGPAAQVLMDHGEWASAQFIIGMGHNVKTDGNFKADRGEITTAVIPQLEEGTRQLLIGVRAAKKLQANMRMRRRQREEAEAMADELERRAEEARRKRLEEAETPLKPIQFFKASRQCLEVSTRNDSLAIPPIASVVGGNRFHGLRALLAAAPISRSENIAAVTVQCGTFPQFKWAITPNERGVRNMVVVPDTPSLGSWYNREWLQPAHFFESKVPLLAKAVACFIYGQHRFTFLKWAMIGYGWAGMVAQCLALLIPADQIDTLITFGCPGTFSKTRDFTLVPHGHIVHEHDLVPRMLGESAMPRLRDAILARLEGGGAILPNLPTLREQETLAYYHRYGSHTHLLKVDTQDPMAASTKKKKSIKASRKSLAASIVTGVRLCSPSVPLTDFDVRRLYPNFNAAHYYGFIGRSEGRNLPVPERNCPPYQPLVEQAMDLEADASPELKDRVTAIPSTVEPIAATAPQIMLAYPKLGYSLWEGHLKIPDDYQSDTMMDFQLVDALIKCVTPAAVSRLLGSFLGAVWDTEWIAAQLFDLSGARPGMDEDGMVVSPKQRKARSRRKSSAIAAESVYPLATELVEAFVAKHRFFFTMAPETGGGDEQIDALKAASEKRLHLGGTPINIDGVDEEMRRLMAGADGFHFGWCVAIASTVRSTGKTTLVNALANATLSTPAISMFHKRTARSLTLPAVRMKWDPKKSIIAPPDGSTGEVHADAESSPLGNLKSQKSGAFGTFGKKAESQTFERKGSMESELTSSMMLGASGFTRFAMGHHGDHTGPQSDDDDDDLDDTRNALSQSNASSDGPTVPLFLQLHFQEVRWDGKMAAKMLMRTAAQVLWVVSDDYTLDHLIKTTSFAKDVLSVVVYVPRLEPDPAVVKNLKAFCQERSLPYGIVDLHRPESVEALIRQMLYWMTPSIRFPVNPMELPPNVEVGTLFSLNEDDINAYVENAVRPTFGALASPQKPINRGKVPKSSAVTPRLGFDMGDL